MREARKIQYTLRENWLDLDHAKELKVISRLLDEHPKVAELVLQDLRAASASPQASRGTGGLSAEQVLRILVVKQMNGFSYRELAFHLADSRSYRTFCRLGITDKLPSKSALNANLKALQPGHAGGDQPRVRRCRPRGKGGDRQDRPHRLHRGGVEHP